MTVVGVVGVGKARGVSTVACGLAAAAADSAGSSLLVESDCSGGDIGYWRKVDVENNSLIEAAAAVGVSESQAERLDALSSYCSHAPGAPTCSVLAMRAAGELATQVRGFWDAAGGHVATLAGPVIADLGQFSAGGVSEAVWRQHVDVGVVVANGDVASLKRLHHLSRSMPVLNRFATVVVVNGSQWPLDEISRSVDVEVHSLLSWEPKAAQMIRVGAKRWGRSTLGRELVGVWDTIAAGAGLDVQRAGSTRTGE